MENRDSEISKWIENVLKVSEVAIAILDPNLDTDIYYFESSAFWGRFPKIPEAAESNRWHEYDCKFEVFSRYATLEEKQQFIKN